MNKKEKSAEVDSLMELGFSAYEARIYVSLLTSSPATAYEVSKRTGIARANVYSSCESLLSKNAVESIGDRPARIVPVPPKLLLSNIATRTSKLCEDLEETLANVGERESGGFIWSLVGQSPVTAKISEMINGAKRNIWIKASSELLETHKEQLRRALVENPDLSCVIILFGENPKDYELSDNTSVYPHEATGIRLGNADNLFTVSVDHQEALTARMEKEVLAAYTTHEPIVTMADTIIRHDIYMAEILQEFGDAIEKKFGPHLYKLRQNYFAKEQFDIFAKNLKAME